MFIRVMTPEDYADVFALWRECAGMGLRAQDDSEEGIVRYLKRNPTTSFVAFEDGELAGAVLAGHDGRRGYVYHAAVRERFRNRGIARAMLDRVHEALEREGISRLGLLVLNANASGKAFWKKRGWRERADLAYFSRAVRPEADDEKNRRL